MTGLEMKEAGVVKDVGGRKLLYVMAAEAEYGQHLRRRFEPMICHVGPVEAAARVARRLALEPDVDAVVSLGSAGSRTLKQAEIYQIDSISYRDMDATALGFAAGETPFLGLPATLELPFSIPGVPQASLATGASIVTGDHYGRIDADLVDMESYAILRACMLGGVPMLGLRGVSDGAEPVAELSDWTRYLEVIDEKMAEIVDRLEAEVTAGLLDPQ